MRFPPSHDDGARKPRTLQTTESLAMLHEQLTSSRASAVSSSAAASSAEEPPLSLQLSLRRGRLVGLVVGLVGAVIAFTVVFARGAELERFDRRDVSASEQEKLLNRYNSYSGTVTSALGRPLEVFVAIVVHVVTLWLVTESVLVAATRWRVKLVVLALGGSVGFLLTNGLNALNVQVRELPVRPVLSASDLRVDEANATGAATMAASFPESQPRNPATNTVLRNLLLPRATQRAVGCAGAIRMDDDSVAFAMPQRAWMKDFLPVALPTATLRIDLLANTTAPTTTSAFPMDAHVAADLLVAGIYTGASYAPFSASTPFVLGNGSLQTYGTSDAASELTVPTARLAGLLPANATTSEDLDRAWFLNRSVAFVRAATPQDKQNASLVRWDMTLARVNVTPSMYVDAITLEREVVPVHLPVTTLGGARYYAVGTDHPVGASAAHRFFPRDSTSASDDARVHAFAACVNADGSETLRSTLPRGSRLADSTVMCANTSASSFYVFSSGVRVVADALYENGTQRLNGTVAVNLRWVYSTTLARVHWRPENLSLHYHAACHDLDSACMGLDAVLAGETAQRLLVGVTALPVSQLTRLALMPLTLFPSQRPLALVSVRRPTKIESVKYSSTFGSTYLGDPLLPHNVRELNVDRTRALTGNNCDPALETRAQLVVNNHMYIETTLQATYTAAAFFLFQNAVAKDVLPQLQSSAAAASVSLALDRNVQPMSVWLSVPQLNAVLTLAGCAVLVIALVVALWQSPAHGSPQLVTTPHVVARVLADDTTFPSLLLKRQLTQQDVTGDADEFHIDALSVKPANATDDHKASMAGDRA